MSAHDDAGRECFPGPGKGPVSTGGIVSIAAYLVVLFFFLSYLLIKVWPHCEPTAAAIGSESHTTSTTETAGSKTETAGSKTETTSSTSPASKEPDCKDPTWIEFFWGSGYWVWEEVRFLLLVLIAGAIGALVHCFRSLFWYVGCRDLRWSWLLMYVLMPFKGSVLALAFYFVIRGGFFPQAKAEQSNPISFLALAIVIGIFSGQAALKLKLVFETLFAAPPAGSDHVPPQPTPVAPPPAGSGAGPKISNVSPEVGSVNGGDTLTISGTGFSEGVTVTFGEKPATASTFINSTTVNAVTPANPAGKVDVVVTNKDGGHDTLTKRFTYQ